VKELEDCDNMLRETRTLLDVARDEKRECERKLAAADREVQSLTLQLQQKQTEIQRSRNLVRLFCCCC